MAAAFSFHPLQLVARAVTATHNCHSAACLLFLTVLHVVFGHPGLPLSSGNPVLTNQLVIIRFLCCFMILVIMDHWSWSCQRNAPSRATMHHDPSHLGLVILLWNAHFFDAKYVKNNQQYVQSYLTSSMFLYHFMMGFFQVCHPSLDSLYLQTKFSKLIRSG